jgi:hypothetical protein
VTCVHAWPWSPQPRPARPACLAIVGIGAPLLRWRCLGQGAMSMLVSNASPQPLCRAMPCTYGSSPRVRSFSSVLAHPGFRCPILYPTLHSGKQRHKDIVPLY